MFDLKWFWIWACPKRTDERGIQEGREEGRKEGNKQDIYHFLILHLYSHRCFWTVPKGPGD